jgi:hypothetical protein
MIEIKSEKKSYGISFPTSISELTPDVLTSITEQVKLPKHYCIIALCFKTRLFDFVVAMNSKKEHSVSVVPVVAKISQEDIEETGACVGDKVILSRSALEMGTHLNLPIMISTDNARNYFAADEALTKSIINRSNPIFANLTKRDNIIVLEFKIIPVVDIKGSVLPGASGIDPFITNSESVN